MEAILCDLLSEKPSDTVRVVEGGIVKVEEDGFKY